MLANVEISYIIVCYNSEKHIAKCLDSILDQSHQSFEIIVVDNNSTDTTKLIVEKFCKKNKQARLISNLHNVGYGNAITIGLQNSNGEFLAILNADAFLDKDWASNMLKIFKSNSEIMSASGTILFPNGELQTTGGMMDRYGAIVQRDSSIFNSRNIGTNVFFYNDGSCFMLRRRILEETSFDPNLFLYYEDVDLSWKIHMLGFKIGHVKEAISYHDSGQSLYDVNPSKFYYLAKNRLYVCTKNYSTQKTLSRVLVSIFLVFLNSVIYDITKSPKGYIKSFFRAISWNMKHLGLIMSEQKRLNATRKITQEELDRYLVPKSIELALL